MTPAWCTWLQHGEHDSSTVNMAHQATHAATRCTWLQHSVKDSRHIGCVHGTKKGRNYCLDSKKLPKCIVSRDIDNVCLFLLWYFEIGVKPHHYIHIYLKFFYAAIMDIYIYILYIHAVLIFSMYNTHNVNIYIYIYCMCCNTSYYLYMQ